MTLARIKKGDTVQIISGRERGKTGKILELLTKKERALVEHLNLVKRHKKAKSQKEPGGIMEQEAALPLSVLLPFCPKCNKGVRVKTGINKVGDKTRICVKCGGSLDAQAQRKKK